MQIGLLAHLTSGGTTNTKIDDEGDGMSGRICLVTGASSGIGKATAAGLAGMGATVVMVARDRARGATAQADVRQAAVGARKGDVDLLLADLASLDSVRQLAVSFSARYGKLRVLVNNAGVILASRTVTGDGSETTFEVNHLSHFLLINLLLETLEGSAPSRIVNVSSGAHTGGHIDFDDLREPKKRYSAMGAYTQSKLAKVLHLRARTEAAGDRGDGRLRPSRSGGDELGPKVRGDLA